MLRLLIVSHSEKSGKSKTNTLVLVDLDDIIEIVLQVRTLPIPLQPGGQEKYSNLQPSLPRRVSAQTSNPVYKICHIRNTNQAYESQFPGDRDRTCPIPHQ